MISTLFFFGLARKGASEPTDPNAGGINCSTDEAVDCLSNCVGCTVDPYDALMCPPGTCDNCDMYLECLDGGDVDCESDEAKDCISNCGGCADNPYDPNVCPDQCDACAIFGTCIFGDGGVDGGVDCFGNEAMTCFTNCAGCAVDPDDELLCPQTCDACDEFIACIDGGDGFGLGSGSGETEEPTAEPSGEGFGSGSGETFEPTAEPSGLCVVDEIAYQMTQAFLNGQLPVGKVVPCQQTGSHLRAISDGVGGLNGEPDYSLICSCLEEFSYVWANEHLNCVVGGGISADDVHDDCISGVHDVPSTEPTDPPTDAPTAEVSYPVGSSVPTRAPTQQPVEAEKTYTLTWSVRICCMTKEECEATGESVKSVLGSEADFSTECVAVSGDGRRRNTGETWDAQYTMQTPSQDEANDLRDDLDDESTQDEIKSKIETDSGATVSTFEPDTPIVAETKKGGNGGGDSGLGAGAIIGIVAGVSIFGAILGFGCYKMGKNQPSEVERQLSPRLVGNGFEPVHQDEDDIEGRTPGGVTGVTVM